VRERRTESSGLLEEIAKGPAGVQPADRLGDQGGDRDDAKARPGSIGGHRIGDKDVAPAHRRVDVQGRLDVGEAGGGAASKPEPKFSGDGRSQCRVGRAGEEDEILCHRLTVLSLPN